MTQLFDMRHHGSDFDLGPDALAALGGQLQLCERKIEVSQGFYGLFYRKSLTVYPEPVRQSLKWNIRPEASDRLFIQRKSIRVRPVVGIGEKQKASCRRRRPNWT